MTIPRIPALRALSNVADQLINNNKVILFYLINLQINIILNLQRNP